MGLCRGKGTQTVALLEATPGLADLAHEVMETAV